jgi:hypothetical protein
LNVRIEKLRAKVKLALLDSVEDGVDDPLLFDRVGVATCPSAGARHDFCWFIVIGESSFPDCYVGGCYTVVAGADGSLGHATAGDWKHVVGKQAESVGGLLVAVATVRAKEK